MDGMCESVSYAKCECLVMCMNWTRVLTRRMQIWMAQCKAFMHNILIAFEHIIPIFIENKYCFPLAWNIFSLRTWIFNGKLIIIYLQIHVLKLSPLKH